MMRKIRRALIPSAMCGLFSAMVLPGCTGDGTSAGNRPSVDSIPVDTTVYLDAAHTGSPSCHIKICFRYLKPAGDNDSLVQAVNHLLEDAFYSAHAGTSSPQEFVRSVKESLASDYLKDVGGSYQADLKNGMKPEDTPEWYNYEYRIVSKLEAGKDRVWNYAVTTFQNTGGAHPNTWARWINVDAGNGKILDKSRVFVNGADKDICRLILDKLVAEANKKLDTDTLTCVEGLQSAGILLDTDLYVPDNFLLGKDGVTFLYNTYDIAPYYMGRFELTVPYEEINTYLAKK